MTRVGIDIMLTGWALVLRGVLALLGARLLHRPAAYMPLLKLRFVGIAVVLVGVCISVAARV